MSVAKITMWNFQSPAASPLFLVQSIFFSWRNHKACLLNQIINSLCYVTILTDWFTVFGKKKTSFFTIRSSCLLRHRNTEAVACSSCIRSTRTNLQVVKEIHRNYGMQWSKWDFYGISWDSIWTDTMNVFCVSFSQGGQDRIKPFMGYQDVSSSYIDMWWGLTRNSRLVFTGIAQEPLCLSPSNIGCSFRCNLDTRLGITLFDFICIVMCICPFWVWKITHMSDIWKKSAFYHHRIAHFWWVKSRVFNIIKWACLL